MSITALADRRISVYRRTAIVLDPTPAASSMAPTRQPASAASVAVVVGGSPGSGSVTVNGTVGGSPDSETLVFAAPGRKETLKRFSAISSLGTAGLADESPAATVSASAVGSDGSPIDRSVLVVSSWPARKDAGSASWPSARHGSAELEQTRLYVAWTTAWAPRSGDAIVDERTGEEWLVVGEPAQHGGGSYTPHHWEITVKRREGSR